MSAFARGAAGFLRVSGAFDRRGDGRRRAEMQTQAEKHLARFLKPERARELAAEAVRVSYKPRKRISTAP